MENKTNVCCNNRLCTLSKPTSGNNEMGVENVSISYPMAALCRNSIMWMPIGVPLSYIKYVIVFWSNMWGDGLVYIEDDMVMNIFILYVLLSFIGCVVWIGVENVPSPMCYRSNPEQARTKISKPLNLKP